MGNILFLDFDGVLITHDSNQMIKESCVETLNKMCQDLDIDRIVISSSWGNFHTFEYLSGMLEYSGVEVPAIAITPKKLSSNKNHEIFMWLRDNGNPDNYYVIDDELIEMGGVPKEKIIHVKDGWDNVGLEEKHYRHLLEG